MAHACISPRLGESAWHVPASVLCWERVRGTCLHQSYAGRECLARACISPRLGESAWHVPASVLCWERVRGTCMHQSEAGRECVPRACISPMLGESAWHVHACTSPIASVRIDYTNRNYLVIPLLPLTTVTVVGLIMKLVRSD